MEHSGGKMKIAIVGSRDYHDLAAVWRYVESLPEDTVIVSGGARGVDAAAEMAAKSRGMETEIQGRLARPLQSAHANVKPSYSTVGTSKPFQ